MSKSTHLSVSSRRRCASCQRRLRRSGPPCALRPASPGRGGACLTDQAPPHRTAPQRTAAHRTGLSGAPEQTGPRQLLSGRKIHAASRRHDEDERQVEGRRFTCGRLSEEAGWRGAGGDLWPLRILFWRILSGGRTVRMRI